MIATALTRDVYVPDDIQTLYASSEQYFPAPIQQLQFFDKYSRFDWGTGRRETWVETVDRAVDYLRELSANMLSNSEYELMRTFILEMRALPSMRLLAMSGDAARRQNLGIYNCSYVPVDSIDAFVEALIISMSGCGVGFSVESQYVNQLPHIVPYHGERLAAHVIEDSTEGWADAVRLGFTTWFGGGDILFDYSQIRPAGSVLKTKGGRASGHEPLMQTLNFARRRIMQCTGRGITTLDAHDLMCMIGSAAVSGGMRRTAMLSLFDQDDELMLHCKDGDFEARNPQRWNANNSAVIDFDSMTQQQFVARFGDMVQSERGEPGMYSRVNAEKLKPLRRQSAVWGTNPCGEIVMRPMQLCNLSIAVARADDTVMSLAHKVQVASMIGTIQSMATHFPGLRSDWKKNCEDERLLGVDITGQMDCAIVQDSQVQDYLKHVAVSVNKSLAKRLGINQSASVTTVKPSGNSSQLLNCSSGLHSRWAPYYIRHVRVSAVSPVYLALRDSNVPMEPENGQTAENANTWVVPFPMKAPSGSLTRNDRSAVEQCAYWLQVRRNYTEHNPSVTITYRPNEVLDLMQWVWRNKSEIIGMSFLPSFDAQYDLLPYVEITQEEYERRVTEFPKIDFSRIAAYETSDETNAAQTLACVGGLCMLDEA